MFLVPNFIHLADIGETSIRHVILPPLQQAAGSA